MAAVMIQQALYDFSNRTAQAIRSGVGRKVAIGTPMDDPRFDASPLVRWRYLAESERPAPGQLSGQQSDPADWNP
jgi:hypothetical protein